MRTPRNKTHLPASRVRLGAATLAVGVAVVSVSLIMSAAGSANAAATHVLLGTADPFVVLAGAGITNTGPTTLNGDIGTFPTTSISGAGSMTITGTNHGGSAVTQGAKSDLVTAYNTARDANPRNAIAADLTGRTLLPGVYNSASSVGLSGSLTLNGQGDPDAVFIFQAGSTLTTGSASSVNLINGAQACNVFWQVGSSATLGTGSVFRGTILALTSITVTTGVTIQGRALARNGAVTLDTDTITRPSCTTGSGGGTTTSTPGTGGSTPGTGGSTPGSGGTPGGTSGHGAPGATPASVPGSVPGAPAPGGSVPNGGTPGHQVTVPKGGVAAGDGSTIGQHGNHDGIVLGTVALIGLGAGAAFVTRRRWAS